MPFVLTHPSDSERFLVSGENSFHDAAGWFNYPCLSRWTRDPFKATLFETPGDAEQFVSDAIAGAARAVAAGSKPADSKVPKSVFSAMSVNIPLSRLPDKTLSVTELWVIASEYAYSGEVVFLSNNGNFCAKSISDARFFPSEAAARDKVSRDRSSSGGNFALLRLSAVPAGVVLGPAASRELVSMAAPFMAYAEAAEITDAVRPEPPPAAKRGKRSI